ncbi:MAG: hypothetical protein IIU92_05315 [Bacteroidaceae bacterium]|nr:hypothetical protein [Bacteroidaceae bacterium]
MDKNQFIDEYLNGRHPIEQEKWELPSESELDQDEALFDALLAQNPKAPLLARRFRGGLLAAAAVLMAAVALFAWWDFKPQGQPQLAETKEAPVEQKDTIKVIEKPHESKSQSSHEKSANFTREVSKVHTRSLKTAQATSAEEKASPPTPLHGEGRKEASLLGGRLEGGSAADSLNYYLTQLEKQMGDCSDNTCLAELTDLMRADERIKDLVNKIIHKQVETAYQEEYLVDTTTRYIPL